MNNYSEVKVPLSIEDIEKLNSEFEKAKKVSYIGIPILIIGLFVSFYFDITMLSIFISIVTTILVIAFIFIKYRYEKNISNGFKLIINGEITKMEVKKGINFTRKFFGDLSFRIDRVENKISIYNTEKNYTSITNFNALNGDKEFYYYITVSSKEMEVDKKTFVLFDVGNKVYLEKTSIGDILKIEKK